jgi:hypothetical protein
MLVGDLAVLQEYRFFEERYLNLEKKIKKFSKLHLKSTEHCVLRTLTLSKYLQFVNQSYC